jgi:hypothetical protein
VFAGLSVDGASRTRTGDLLGAGRSEEASPGERWFVVGSGLAFLGLLGVAFLFAVVRPSAMYPSPFWPRDRIEQFFAENRAQVRTLGSVHTLVALSLLAFGTSLSGLLRADAGESVPFFWAALGAVIVASAFFMLSGILVWALSRPATVESPPLLRTLHDLAYLAGGPAHVLAIALFLGANSAAIFATDVLPEWIAWLGVAGAAVSALAPITMLWYPAAWILPVTRLLLAAWILSVVVQVAA